MTLAQFVPADKLINKLAEYLKENFKEITPPPWSFYVKTGRHTERVPTQPNMWYIRCASLLRQIYLEGPVGVERLRTFYGGRAKKGMRREHFYKASGAWIRKPLQQLEKAGLVTKLGTRGRVVTDKGKSIVDRIAYKILRELQKEMPEISKYIVVKGG
ncbi:MAG: 30S ribosomal protein S19e [Candidatus Methanomethylicaceae archaeon]|nr:30S ribosomal protein S19e [Candidatus Verstraetearchaeota archaeon]